jgi:hypothetical protein
MTRLWSILGITLVVLTLVTGTTLAAPRLEAPGPQDAALLVAEGVSGHLAPGEAAWYQYFPGGAGTSRSDNVTLIFSPAVELGAQVSGVNFRILSSGQVTNGSDATVVTPIGTGSYVSRDGDPNTGEYLWQGKLPGSDAYYVRVHNDTNSSIDFWLYPGDIVRVESMPTPVGEAAPASAAPGDAPQDLPWAAPATGHLEPAQESWYRWVPTGDVAQRQDSSFTLFFTPGNTLFADWVASEVMTTAQREARERGQSNANTGAGAIVSRDGNPLTGERLWRGQLVAGEVYLVRIANASDAPIDYWLFQGDIDRPVFPPPAEATPTPTTVPTMTSAASAQPPTTAPSPITSAATVTPAASPTATAPGRPATATANPTAPQPTASATPVSPSDLVPSKQSNALNWEDWHVAVTCVTHCDQE